MEDMINDEMDILKEIGTTAAAHGSIALSEILGKKITLELPSINILPREKLTKSMNIEGMVMVLQTKILSGFDGMIMFFLEEKSAFKLIDTCYKPKDGSEKPGLFTEIGMSVIKEISNIIVASYISSLSFFTKKLIIPSFPVLINAPFSEIVKMVCTDYEKENHILVIDAILKEEQEQIKGTFWLVLTPQTAEEIKTICKRMLQD